MFNALNSKYSRAEIQQFNQRISWFVGQSPSAPEKYTMKFGAFREFSCRYRDANIQGWAIGSQKMSRQTVEIYGDSESNRAALKAVNDVFESVYTVKGIEPDRPLLYRVRSLILQMLVYYSQDSGNSWQEVLDQLAGMGWVILGSSRFWERFLEFRKMMSEPSESMPPLGQFSFDQRLLRLNKYSDIEKTSNRRNLDELESGPGHLHRSLVSFIYLLTHDLYEQGLFESIELADLYLSDAIGFPKSLGSSLVFAKRLGLLRIAEAKYAMEVRSY
jgi:hypothetical protein